MLKHTNYIKLKIIYQLTMFLRRAWRTLSIKWKKECMGEGSLALLSRKYGAF